MWKVHIELFCVGLYFIIGIYSAKKYYYGSFFLDSFCEFSLRKLNKNYLAFYWTFVKLILEIRESLISHTEKYDF